ncbi:MAG: exodeoxyribonuclease VII small subunit [Planctomycetes bacterium]|nr:exodeoxyribonuclease VII small subunit [Planctomycetota bacterium]
MPQTNGQSNGDPAAEQSFEQRMVELEQIVRQLEDGSLGLEESLSRFEQAIGLVRGCYRTLENVEQRIEQLCGFDADGNAVTKAFDGSATFDGEDPAAGRRKTTRTRKPRPQPDPPEKDEAEEEQPGRKLF